MSNDGWDAYGSTSNHRMNKMGRTMCSGVIEALHVTADAVRTRGRTCVCVFVCVFVETVCQHHFPMESPNKKPVLTEQLRLRMHAPSFCLFGPVQENHQSISNGCLSKKNTQREAKASLIAESSLYPLIIPSSCCQMVERSTGS